MNNTNHVHHDAYTCPVCGGKLKAAWDHDWQASVEQPWECTCCHATGHWLSKNLDDPAFIKHVNVWLADGTQASPEQGGGYDDEAMKIICDWEAEECAQFEDECGFTWGAYEYDDDLPF